MRSPPCTRMLMQIYCFMVWFCTPVDVTGRTQRKRLNRSIVSINKRMLIGYLNSIEHYHEMQSRDHVNELVTVLLLGSVLISIQVSSGRF